MGAHGFFTANEGHVTVPLFPKSITGGITGARFSMAKYQHASIIVVFGATVAQPTAILVKTNTAASGGTSVAQGYRMYAQETADNDVLGPKQAIAATGYQPVATSDIFYVIEIDADELPAGSNYVEMDITAPAGAQLACIVAVLSGSRYAEDQSPTVLT